MGFFSMCALSSIFIVFDVSFCCTHILLPAPLPFSFFSRRKNNIHDVFIAATCTSGHQ